MCDGFFEQGGFFRMRSASPLTALVSAGRSLLVGTSWGPSIATHCTTLPESHKHDACLRLPDLWALAVFVFRSEGPKGKP